LRCGSGYGKRTGMNTGSPVFAQVVARIHREQFGRCVARYGGDRLIRSFSCGDQFRSMAFAQMTYRESLRDIEACLNARPHLLHHMGFSGPIARSTLADANEKRPFQIYADLAQILIKRARQLYAGDELDLELENTAYALDSTTITLSLGLCPWARFRSGQAGVKVHTQLDLRGPIPAFIHITPQRVHDVRFLELLVPEPNAIYVMDRAYLSLARLHHFHQAGAFFVVRGFDRFAVNRTRSLPHRDPRIRADQIGHARKFYPRRDYPNLLRRIHFIDPSDPPIDLILVTNLLEAQALDIARLYKYRWDIELFFKWIKQNLRIRAFYGLSLNAIQTQIWIAISIYVLVALIQKELNIEHSLHRILQVLSVSPFEKLPLSQLFTKDNLERFQGDFHNQLVFNGF
jgi:hypothetical protein